jgi:hypothetical protein
MYSTCFFFSLFFTISTPSAIHYPPCRIRSLYVYHPSLLVSLSWATLIERLDCIALDTGSLLFDIEFPTPHRPLWAGAIALTKLNSHERHVANSP